MCTTDASAQYVSGSLITPRWRRLFTHFFDVHFLDEKGVSRFEKQATNEARLATRFAIMLADTIFVPAASYYESPICRNIVDEYDPEMFAGQIVLVASGSSVEEFLEYKRLQYNQDQSQGRAYRQTDLPLTLPWRRRKRGATAGITQDWLEELASGQTSAFFNRVSRYLDVPSDHERRWETLPEHLGQRAFILENATPHLFGVENVSLQVRNRLHSIINPSYFRSYTTDLEASIFRNMIWLESPDHLPSGAPEGDVDFKMLVQACRQSGLLSIIAHAPPTALLELRNDERFVMANIDATCSVDAADSAP
jgi:hypothetical protein